MVICGDLSRYINMNASENHLDKMSTKNFLVVLATLIVLILCSFYFPYLTLQKDFYIGDVSLYFEPLCRYIAEALKSGRLPLWNTLSYCGMPQIAIPSPGLFYVPNLLFVLCPFSQALALSLILHQLLAGIGGFLLGKSFQLKNIAAGTLGIVLALSGYMFSLEANYTLVANAAWLPLSLWALKRIDGRLNLQNAWKIITCSIIVAQFLSCGRPEITAPGLLMFGACSLISPSETNENLRKKRFFLCWLSLFLAALLSMPTILPALEWLPLSRRASGMSNQEAFIYSANWYDYLTMIFGQALGDLHLRWAKFLNLVNTRPRLMPYLSSAYVGPIVLTLAYWGMRTDFPKKKLTLIALLISVIASLGDQSPIMPFLGQIFPALNVVRFPIKFLYFVVFFIALLAAFGSESLLNKNLNRTTFRQTLFLWLVPLTAGLVSLLNLPLFQNVLLLLQKTTTPELAQEGQLLLGQALLNGSLLAIVFVIACWWWQKKDQSILPFALPIILTATLMYSAFAYSRHEAPYGFFNNKSSLALKISELTNKAESQRIAGLYLEQFTCPADYGIQPADASQATINWSAYGQVMLRPNCNMDLQIPSIFGYESAMIGRYYDLLLSVYLKSSQCIPLTNQPITDIPLGRFLQMTATQYVVTQAYRYPGLGFPAQPITKLDPSLFQLIYEDPKLNARIYSVINTLPRAYFIGACERADSKIGNLIEEAETTGFDPHKLSFMEADGETPLPHLEIPVLPLTITEDKPESIDIQADCPSPGVVVLADQFYPGWICTVDDAPANIMRVNSFARGVIVNSGKHSVKFRYRPHSLAAGLALAFSSLVIMLGLLFYFRLSVRRK